MPTAEDSIAKAEALMEKNTPAGWTRRFVEPPWRGLPPRCRACGRDPALTAISAPGLKWANMAIVKYDSRQKIVWYSFGLCCETCGQQKKVLDKLAVEIFMPLAPENVGPELTVEVKKS